MSGASAKIVRRLTGSRSARSTLITGGAGFIGANLAHRLLSNARPVLILDNLSRAGVEQNLQWLREVHGDAVEILVEDVRNRSAVEAAVARASQVFHFAAQVAVTTSLADPIEDFSINAQGTLNVLEAIRAQSDPPPLVLTSTNKVYGGLDDVPLTRERQRYAPADPETRAHGISERRALDFHSPYGCSKGAADQYVRDYARCYGIPAVVFRMSCIYGPHQCGNEDQGWVAHFAKRVLQGEPITFYGDGCQVRDILFVEDLVRAMRLAIGSIEDTRGQIYNLGGGPEAAVSLRDVVETLGELHGVHPVIRRCDWRQGDQVYYVTDTRKFQHATGWRPEVDVRRGVERLYLWLKERSSAVLSHALL